MIDRNQQGSDDFWDVKAQERRTQESFHRQIEQLQRVINMGRQTLSLRSQPGFNGFIEALEGLRQAELTKLVASVSSNEEMRVTQGKVQALHDVLAVLKDTEKSIEGLEARLKAVQNEAATVVTAGGKVITDPIGVPK